MAWVWSTLGAFGVALGLVYIAASFVAYAVAPRRALNRLLAAFLFLQGTNVATGGGLMYLNDAYNVAYGFQMVAYASGWSSLALYILFLGRALSTPLLAPARHRLAPYLLGAGALVIEALRITRGDLFIRGLRQTTYGAWENEGGVLSAGMFQAFAAVCVFALVAALHTWQRSQAGTEARRRAKLYALAFAIQDIPIIVYGLIWQELPDAGRTVLGYALYGVLFAFPPILIYAMIRGQLFDIDIRLKITLRRGVLASAFVFVFLVFSQAGQNLLNETLGLVLGAVASSLLLFALAPLQRAADRLANAAMPTVRDTEAYRTYRKMEVYREAYEAFMVDGRINARERTALQRLRAKLGLAPGLVGRLEKEIAGTA